MANFEIDKKGYNTSQVDEYITDLSLKYEEKLHQQKDRVTALRNEVNTLNSRLADYVEKEEQISKALLYAVEKSEQIEKNARSAYNMEMKRLNDLYTRWENLLLEVEKKYPDINDNTYINSLMEEFKISINEVSQKGLNLNTKSIRDDLKYHSDQFVKNILNKMDFVVNNKSESVVSTKNEKKKLDISYIVNQSEKSNQNDNLYKVDLSKIHLDKDKMKNINRNGSMLSISERLKKLNLGGNKLESGKKNESMAERFLNSNDDIAINAYSKNFAKKKLEKNPFMFMEYPEPNETGFDLKDALNPKEDLDEIMKSFSFFDGDKK